MYHCPKRNKGILDKKFANKGVVFRKSMNYQRVLEKCVSAVFPNDSKDGKHYIANGRGIPIYSGDSIPIDNEDGNEELIPWTLDAYIKLSSFRYASKARLYCVKYYTAGDHIIRTLVYLDSAMNVFFLQKNPLMTVMREKRCLPLQA